MLRPYEENRTVPKDCLKIDLGLIGYAEAYALQQRVVAARKAGAIEDVLLFCEHPHVITQGRNGKREHLLVSEHVLRQKGVEFYETSRGGDITYHGPGQIVGYPILNLGAIRRDVVLPRKSWPPSACTSAAGSLRTDLRTTCRPTCGIST